MRTSLPDGPTGMGVPGVVEAGVASPGLDRVRPEAGASGSFLLPLVVVAELTFARCDLL